MWAGRLKTGMWGWACEHQGNWFASLFSLHASVCKCHKKELLRCIPRNSISKGLARPEQMPRSEHDRGKISIYHLPSHFSCSNNHDSSVHGRFGAYSSKSCGARFKLGVRPGFLDNWDSLVNKHWPAHFREDLQWNIYKQAQLKHQKENNEMSKTGDRRNKNM